MDRRKWRKLIKRMSDDQQWCELVSVYSRTRSSEVTSDVSSALM